MVIVNPKIILSRDRVYAHRAEYKLIILDFNGVRGAWDLSMSNRRVQLYHNLSGFVYRLNSYVPRLDSKLPADRLLRD